jgi:hypothetical protein
MRKRIQINKEVFRKLDNYCKQYETQMGVSLNWQEAVNLIVGEKLNVNFSDIIKPQSHLIVEKFLQLDARDRNVYSNQLRRTGQIPEKIIQKLVFYSGCTDRKKIIGILKNEIKK